MTGNQHHGVAEAVGEPAAGDWGEDDCQSEQEEEQTDLRIGQTAFLTEVDGDKGINDSVRELIETPRDSKRDAFTLPERENFGQEHDIKSLVTVNNILLNIARKKVSVNQCLNKMKLDVTAELCICC